MRHPLGTAIAQAPIPDGLRIEGYTAETDEEFRAVRNEAAHELGGSQLSAEEWKVWAVNANFRRELSFLLRDVETGTAAGVLLAVSWEAETVATGIRDAYFRVIATRPAYEGRVRHPRHPGPLLHRTLTRSSRSRIRGCRRRRRAVRRRRGSPRRTREALRQGGGAPRARPADVHAVR